MKPTFDDLIEEALVQHLTGWDFAWLAQRSHDEPLPWDYRALVTSRLPEANSLLDIDTGGGEFLASLAPLPPRTWATEGYVPNVPLARARLEPLGVQVVDVSQSEANLPFDAAQFNLVINRHGGIYAQELAHVLCRGGRYITQQVGGRNCIEINKFLEDTPSFVYQHVTLPGILDELETAGLRILEARECFPRFTFLDVAGVVFYLQAISWQIPDFTVETYRDKLLDIHRRIENEGGWTIHQHRFLIEAVR
jgi:hypothetical protein